MGERTNPPARGLAYSFPSGLSRICEYRRSRNLTLSALAMQEFADFASSAFTAGMEFHQFSKIIKIKHGGWDEAHPIPRKCYVKYLIVNYSMIAETTPEPTVLPPSRIAKRRPSSQAMGVISSTVMSTLSPGRHISTPAGREITPVTSVVLK